jgi:hypothetical protein
MLASIKDYPRVGWQDLNTESRRELKAFPALAVNMHNHQVLRDYPAFVVDSIQEDADWAGVTLGAWETKRMPSYYREMPEEEWRPQLLTGFMMIDTSHEPEIIVERFRKWLLKRHPAAKKTKPETRGRKSYRDRLNALGAMRLRFYCRTLSEAQKVAAPLRDKEQGLFYGDRTAWNRACDRAAEYYREVLNLPEKELPIHFSKGWQK